MKEILERFMDKRPLEHLIKSLIKLFKALCSYLAGSEAWVLLSGRLHRIETIGPERSLTKDVGIKLGLFWYSAVMEWRIASAIPKMVYL